MSYHARRLTPHKSITAIIDTWVLHELPWLSARAHAPSAEAEYMSRLAELEVQRKITRLPPYLARVAWLRYAGDSCLEIALALGIKVQVVKNQLWKIRSPQLRQVLMVEESIAE